MRRSSLPFPSLRFLCDAGGLSWSTRSSGDVAGQRGVKARLDRSSHVLVVSRGVLSFDRRCRGGGGPTDGACPGWVLDGPGSLRAIALYGSWIGIASALRLLTDRKRKGYCHTPIRNRTSGSMTGCWGSGTVELVRHRQTNGAGTDRLGLPSHVQCLTLPPDRQLSVHERSTHHDL